MFPRYMSGVALTTTTSDIPQLSGQILVIDHERVDATTCEFAKRNSARVIPAVSAARRRPREEAPLRPPQQERDEPARDPAQRVGDRRGRADAGARGPPRPHRARSLPLATHNRIDAKRQALDALDEALRGAETNGNASGGEAGDTTGDAPEPPDSDADIPLC